MLCSECRSQLELGNWELEIVTQLSDDDFLSGRIFIGASKSEKTPFLIKEDRPTKKQKKNQQASQNVLQLQPSTAPVRSNGNSVVEINEGDFVLNKSKLASGQSPVKVDSFLAKSLRTHQRDGVQFLYNCVMGVANPGFQGAILADEMVTLHICFVASLAAVFLHVPKTALARDFPTPVPFMLHFHRV